MARTRRKHKLKPPYTPDAYAIRRGCEEIRDGLSTKQLAKRERWSRTPWRVPCVKMVEVLGVMKELKSEGGEP